MSELTKICLITGFVLAVVYASLIYYSITAGKNITPYLICAGCNIAVALWFWYIATRPTGDPQEGMGLGPIMIVCGLITIALPVIAIIVFFIRRFQ